MNYQKDVSNFMILGEQKIASDLNLKNEQTQLYMNLIKGSLKRPRKHLMKKTWLKLLMVLQIWFGSLWVCAIVWA